MTDTVVAPVEPAVETPAAATIAARPDNIPEKFWDATKGTMNTDALLQSYTELEKKVSTPKVETPPVDEAAHGADEAAANAALAGAGLNLETFTDEYATNGTLSAESYASLEKAGFPKAFVDQHIEGALALGESYKAVAFNAAGDEAAYARMTEWAKTSLPDKDIQAFNDGVMGTRADVEKAVKALREKYESATGKEPALLQGGSAGGDVFRSQNEVTAAMRDKRWGHDPAYTADITAKISRSKY